MWRWNGSSKMLRSLGSRSVVAGFVIAGPAVLASAAFPAETASALSAADEILSANLAGTLAGLSLASASLAFSTVSRLQERRQRLQRILDEGELEEKDKPIYRTRKEAVEQKIRDAQGPAIDLVDAFLAFLASLVLMLGLTDSILATPGLSSMLVTRIVDVGSSGAPFLVGLSYLYQGAAKIRKAM